MTEPKWTPGPWHASQTYPPGDWCIHARGIPWQLAYLRGHSEIDWPLEANARLIAAAPELYAGLVELLDETEAGLIASASSRSGRDDDDFREEFPDDYERCKRLRAVLAKARGEP